MEFGTLSLRTQKPFLTSRVVRNAVTGNAVENLWVDQEMSLYSCLMIADANWGSQVPGSYVTGRHLCDLQKDVSPVSSQLHHFRMGEAGLW